MSLWRRWRRWFDEVPWWPDEGEWVKHKISGKRLLLVKQRHKGYYAGTFVQAPDGWIAKDEEMQESIVYPAELEKL